MNKVLALSVASVLLFMISLSEAQSFVESDLSGKEGDTLTFGIDLGNVENSGKISATALTIAAFEAKYPDLEAPCILNQEDAAEENDFNGGTTALVSQDGSNFVSVQFKITEDEKEEPAEIFLLILETVDGLQPLVQPIVRDGVEVNGTICIVGRILASDDDVVSIKLDETLINRTEDAGNVNLAIVRNGATELTKVVTIEFEPCAQFEQLLEGTDYSLAQSRSITLPPTDEEMTEYPILVEIIDDNVPEPDECLSIALSAIGLNINQESGQADIIIMDDDEVTVGFTQGVVDVQEGKSIEVCAAILDPLGDIGNLEITLDITLLASDAQFVVEYPFQMVPKFVLEADFRNECIIVTAIDDEKLERSRTFSIKISAMTPRVTVEPDVVMVTITDNDGTPNSPKVTEAKLVNDDKDLLITWDIEEDELRPVDDFLGTVKETEAPNKRRQIGESITFESGDREETVQGIDAQKQYEIVICARNEFGLNCSDPVFFVPPITGEPLLPEESGGLSTGVIIAIVIILVLLLLCCLLLLLFLLFYCRKERSRKYFPEKNEKKYTEEYERYREQVPRSPSQDSEVVQFD